MTPEELEAKQERVCDKSPLGKPLLHCFRPEGHGGLHGAPDGAGTLWWSQREDALSQSLKDTK